MDFIVDDFKEDMAAKGIQVDRVYYSVSWSQGDGACFEGHVASWTLLLKALGYDNPMVVALARDYWSFSVSHKGHYYHEYSTHFDADILYPDDDECCPYTNPIQRLAWIGVIKTILPPDMEGLLTEYFRRHMRDLHAELCDQAMYEGEDK